MELMELNKELHASIEEVEDETLLLKLKMVLKDESNAEDFSYENSPAFISALNESIHQADDGEFYTLEDTTKWINNREWRTR